MSTGKCQARLRPTVEPHPRIWAHSGKPPVQTSLRPPLAYQIIAIQLIPKTNEKNFRDREPQEAPPEAVHRGPGQDVLLPQAQHATPSQVHRRAGLPRAPVSARLVRDAEEIVPVGSGPLIFILAMCAYGCQGGCSCCKLMDFQPNSRWDQRWGWGPGSPISATAQRSEQSQYGHPAAQDQDGACQHIQLPLMLPLWSQIATQSLYHQYKSLFFASPLVFTQTPFTFSQACFPIIITCTLPQLNQPIMTTPIESIINTSRAALLGSLHSLNTSLGLKNQHELNSKIKVILALLEEGSEAAVCEELGAGGDPEVLESVRRVLARGGGAAQQPGKSVVVEKTPPKDKKAAVEKEKPQAKTAQRGDSILKSVLGKFIKQDPNVRQMILPDKEPKCIYDPVKGKYVFEGQEEEPAKQIPKPPPAKRGPNVTEPAKPAKKTTELDQMMAPPAFKRKGMKKKQIQPAKQAEVSTFEQFQLKINTELQKIKQRFLAELPNPDMHSQTKSEAFPMAQYNQMTKFSETIREAQQISDTLLTRLYSSYIDTESDREGHSQIMEQLARLEESNLRIIGSSIRRGGQRQSEIRNARLQEPQENLDSVIRQRDVSISVLKLENEKLTQEVQSLRKSLDDEREKYRLNIQSEISEVQMLKQAIENKNRQIQQVQQQLNASQEQKHSLRREISGLNIEVKVLKQKLSSFESSLQQDQASLLKNVLEKSKQLSLINEISEALIAENELYLAIQAKRISLCSQGKQAAPVPSQPPQQSSSRLLELSDCYTKTIQTYQLQVQHLKAENMSLNQSHSALKSELSRLQHTLSSQNQSLQRSLARTKALLEDHRLSSQQLQLKSSHLETQNQALQRQLTHLRKQHLYTKQLLEHNIRTSHDNTTVIKEQLEAQLNQAEEQLRTKQQHCRVLEDRLRENNETMEELLSEGRGKAAKLATLDKDLRALRSSLDEAEGTLHELRLRNGDLEAQAGELGARLAEERARHETAVRNCKMQLQEEREKVASLTASEKQLRANNEQLMAMLQQSNNLNENLQSQLSQTRHKAQSLQSTTTSLHSQIASLTASLTSSQELASSLQSQLQPLHSTLASLSNQVISYQQLSQQQTATIQSLMQQLLNIKQQMLVMEQESSARVEQLMGMMGEGEQATAELQRQLLEYEALSRSAMERMGEGGREDVEFMVGQVAEYEAKVEECQARLAEYERTVEAYDAKMKQYERGAAQNEAKIMRQEGELQQVGEERDSLLLQLQQLSTSQAQLQQQTSILGHQLAQKQAVLSETVNKLAEAVSERDTYEQVNLEMENKIQELTSEAETLRAWLEQLRAELRQKQEQSSGRDRQLQEVQKTAVGEKRVKDEASNQEMGSTGNEQVLALQREIQQQAARSEQAMAELKSEIEHRNRRIEQLGVKIREYEIDLLRASQEMTQKDQLLALAFQQNKAKLQSKDATIGELQAKIDETDKLITQYEEMIEEMGTSIKALEAQPPPATQAPTPPAPQAPDTLALTTELASLQSQLAHQWALNETLSKQLAEAQQQMHNLSSQPNQQTIQQQQELQMLVLEQDTTITRQNVELEKLRAEIEECARKLRDMEEHVEQAKRDKTELHQLYIRKSEQAEMTIDRLELRVREAERGEKLLEEIKAKYKDLEEENKELLKEKSEILKTKDQILTKLMSQPNQNKANQPVTNPQPKQNGAKRTTEPPRRAEPPPKPAGFFGSLSTLFLTPTETERLTKAPQQ